MRFWEACSIAKNQYLFKIFDYLFLITHPTRLGALSKRDSWTMHYFYILIPLCSKTIVARIDLDENINFREIDCFHLFYDDRTWRGDQFWVDFTTNNFVQIIHRGKNSCKPFAISKSIYLENTMIMNFFRHKFFITWKENFFMDSILSESALTFLNHGKYSVKNIQAEIGY